MSFLLGVVIAIVVMLYLAYGFKWYTEIAWCLGSKSATLNYLWLCAVIFAWPAVLIWLYWDILFKRD
ncbi:hypothetical protein [Vibrio phage vB_VibM_83AMN]|nr:hypothetical protein [Vibrio phage vB_VibM_83AMN]